MIVVAGAVNTDLVMSGRPLPRPGETVVGGQFHSGLGGKGANQAVAAVRAGGEEVAFLGAVGDDDFGRNAIAGLKASQLDCSRIITIAGETSGVALILVDENGENCIRVTQGPSQRLTEEDIEQLAGDLFAKTDVLLTNFELPLPLVKLLLKRAKQNSVNTILNPAPIPAEMDEEIFQFVDMVTPNETEVAALTGIEVTDLDSARAAANVLRQKGCKLPLITLGSKGVYALALDQIVPSPKVDAVDTTAAGDCFNGALAVAVEETRSLRDALEFAVAAAAISVTRPGAQSSLPNRAEIEAGQQ